MNKKIFIALLVSLVVLVSGCTTTGSRPSDPATRRQAIDASVDNALAHLYQQEPGSRELVSRAKAVLVFPAVLEAGFIVGAARGEGALRVAGESVSFHRTTAGSIGLQAGAKSSAMFVLFMTEDALRNFQNSRGWTAGADASVTMISIGASARMTTSTVQQPVIGYVLSNSGLMAGVSVDGARVTRLNL